MWRTTLLRHQNKHLTQIIMDVDRSLSPDSYKIIYLVYENSESYVDLKISNKNYLKEFSIEEPRWCITKIYWSICNVRNDLFGYQYDREQERRVKYNWLIKLAYLTWLINMCMWIVLPLTMYHDTCLKGLEWKSHVIFLSYLGASYIFEIIFFFWLTDACQQNLFSDLSTMSKCGYKLMRLYYIFGTAFQSSISKAAEYTAIAFMVEIMKWTNDEGHKDDRNLLLSLFAVSLFTFFLTVLYPFIVFVSLIVKTPERTFYPLTAHTTRLLTCADLKLLSRYVERYAINYYGALLWWNQPTFILLTWIKLIFEDMIELVIQLLFVFYIDTGNRGPVIMTAISLTGASIIGSFIIIYTKQTSRLNIDSQVAVQNFIYVNGSKLNNETIEDGKIPCLQIFLLI